MSTPTVLVVDDDPSIVGMVALILEDEGYRVLTAPNGETATHVAHEAHPDVILLDVNMPVLDGVEASKRLRADPETVGIPIVVMSTQQRLEVTASQMPVDDRLAKPFELDQLYSTVARWTNAA